jgi:hypothetical protein
MMIEDDLVARLRERDSSVSMDGAANWVIARHLGDTSRPGQLVVHLPWQADVLLIKAANEIERLRNELEAMRARGGDRARLTCPHCPGSVEELPVLRCIKCGCGYYDEVGGRVR